MSDTHQDTEIHSCEWSEWRKPTGDLVGSCYEYRVCLGCGAVDAAGDPEEDDEDDEYECSHHSCSEDIDSGYLVCDECDAIIRPLTKSEMESAHVD